MFAVKEAKWREIKASLPSWELVLFKMERSGQRDVKCISLSGRNHQRNKAKKKICHFGAIEAVIEVGVGGILSCFAFSTLVYYFCFLKSKCMYCICNKSFSTDIGILWSAVISGRHRHWNPDMCASAVSYLLSNIHACTSLPAPPPGPLLSW